MTSQNKVRDSISIETGDKRDWKKGKQKTQEENTN